MALQITILAKSVDDVDVDVSNVTDTILNHDRPYSWSEQFVAISFALLELLHATIRVHEFS